MGDPTIRKWDIGKVRQALVDGTGGGPREVARLHSKCANEALEHALELSWVEHHLDERLSLPARDEPLSLRWSDDQEHLTALAVDRAKPVITPTKAAGPTK